MSLITEALEKTAQSFDWSSTPQGVVHLKDMISKKQKRKNLQELAKKMGLDPKTGKRVLRAKAN